MITAQGSKLRSLQESLLRVALFPAVLIFIFIVAVSLLAANLILSGLMQQQQLVAQALAQQAEQDLKARGLFLDALSSALADAPEAMKVRLIGNARTAYPSFLTLMYLDAAGRVVVESGGEFRVKGLDLSREPFFQEAIQEDQIVYSMPTVSLATGRVVVRVSAPYFVGKTGVGVLTGEVDLSELQATIDHSVLGNGSLSYVVDSRGTLVAHPNATWVQEQRNLANLPLVHQAIEGKPEAEIYFDPEARIWMIGSTARMQSGWVVVTLQPLSTVSRPLGVMAGGVGLALLATLYLFLRVELRSLRHLTQPISLLVEQADAVSNGDYDRFPSGPWGNFTEIVSLGDSFARMVAAVQERTHSLEGSLAELRAAEDALRISEERYRSLFEAANDATFSLDHQGHLVRINPACSRLLGYGAEELLALSLRDLLTLPTRLTPALWAVVCQTGGLMELTLRHRAGLEIPVELNFSPIPGDLEGAVVMAQARDLTERKQAEARLQEHQEHLEEMVSRRTAELQTRIEEVEQLNQVLTHLLNDLQAAQEHTLQTTRALQEANAELESFAYTVSHDLRSPLRHINGYAHILMECEKDNLDENSLHYLQVIIDAVNRLGRLIDDLLAFSRTGRTEMRSSVINLNELVEVAREQACDPAENRSIHWEVAALPAVRGDASLLSQVWVNLFTNALKFTRPRPEARIEIGWLANSEPGWVTLFVRDNGVGFDPRYTHKLFGVFERLHTPEEFEGTGIGLATLRRIIHRHGGQVWAEGALNEGAVFYFSLPLAEKAVLPGGASEG